MARGGGLALALAALALASVVSGCGEGEGVAAGATVRAYVGAPLCAGAKRELARTGGKAGDVRVQAVCLADAEEGGRLDLATIGVDARRATEDSTAIAFLEAPGPSNRFAQPIVEEAGIAWTTGSSGAKAMRQILHAVAEAGSSSLRDSVREALE